MFTFRCLSYSVSEGAGHAKISIINKQKMNLKIGARTKDDTATNGVDYKFKSDIIEFTPQDEEKIFNVEIVDDD
ncbi:MAG: hypothetical protein ACI9QD_001279 [Thermoproteota archaeon]